MGNADNLCCFSDFMQQFSHHICGLTGNTGIHLIENKTRSADFFRIDFLNGQGYAGKFAPGYGIPKKTRSLTRIDAHHESDNIVAFC